MSATRICRKPIERVGLSALPAYSWEVEPHFLSLGAVEIDTEGFVLKCNSTESEIMDVLSNDLVGKNFFKELAPCTNRKDFYGKFLEIIQHPSNVIIFNYAFLTKDGPVKAQIQMKKSFTLGAYWIYLNLIE